MFTIRHLLLGLSMCECGYSVCSYTIRAA